MKFTSKLIKTEWQIRREAAVKFNCKIMLISWKECIRMAKEKSMEQILVDAGGNLWEKNTMKRVYLNDSALVELFDIDAEWLAQTKKEKKIKEEKRKKEGGRR